jgi:hypothetical protein
MATLTRLESLAGIRIPDSPLAKAAVDLLEATSPQFICNHCVRTYVFGNFAVRSMGRSILDEEITFCAALLHDLGLVPAHAGENRFEVDDADAARESEDAISKRFLGLELKPYLSVPFNLPAPGRYLMKQPVSRGALI